MKVTIRIRRIERKFTYIRVEAPTVDAAEAHVQELLDGDHDSQDYRALMCMADLENPSRWDEDGIVEQHVSSASASADQDDDYVDATVPQKEV